MLWIAFVLSIFGNACLGAVMLRHAADVFGHDATPGQALAARLAGTALLGSALAICIVAEDVSIGIAAWLGVLTPAAMLVGLAFTVLASRTSRSRDSCP
ncbi:MAG: DUF3325 domain-containing protein [Lautropia sp.]